MALPVNISDIARTGVHLEITADCPIPLNISDLIRTVANAGGHIKIDVRGRVPTNASDLARIGREHLTLVF